MLTASPHLRIRRPSPTTADFSVTTAPTPTLTLEILRLSLLTLRIVLALTTASLLYICWTESPFATPLPPSPPSRPSLQSVAFIWYLSDTFQRSAVAIALARLPAAIPLPIIIPSAIAALYVLSIRVHASESLLVMRGLGVQTSESSGTYFASASTRFIPTEKIQDIFINEAFRGFEVRYYLVVVVEGEEEVVVVFPRLLPKRQIVETVWRGVRECLYESRGEEKIYST